jgi:phage shock protein E
LVYERRADEKVLIIDVRTPAEFRQERIEQAVNKPLDEIDKWVNELPKDKTIYFVCRSGNRSGIAQRIAAQRGYENTYNMEGGMIAWRREGLPVIPIARSEFMNCPPPLGSPRFARGTARGALTRFPLRAGGTLRRGSSAALAIVNFAHAIGIMSGD